MTAELIAVFTVGLVGSAHCAGMCGGFALAVAHLDTGLRRQALLLVYYLGKTLTYALLGAVAGGLGAAVASLLTPLQQGLSILLGAVLVLAGIGLMGGKRWLETKAPWANLPRLREAFVFLLRKKGAAAVFGLGLLNGLLPCGLVYGMLALAAATGNAAQGALVMTVFGLSTVPVLHLVGVAGSLVRPAWRTRLSRLGGVLLVLLGLLTAVRATPLLHHVLHPDAPTSTTEPNSPPHVHTH